MRLLSTNTIKMNVDFSLKVATRAHVNKEILDFRCKFPLIYKHILFIFRKKLVLVFTANGSNPYFCGQFISVLTPISEQHIYKRLNLYLKVWPL